MADNESYDVIIIGGGPGGLSAGIYAMRAAMKAVLIEKGVTGGQMAMTDEVDNYPGIEHIGGPDLSMQITKHAQSYGLEIVYQEVLAVEPGLNFHSVKLADGSTLTAHAVIIGTGGNPRKLEIPGEDDGYGKGVSYCGVCDGFFFRGKTVVVIGGGDTAVEEALYLSKLAKRVYLVHRRDALRASMLLQERLKNDCNAEIIWNSIVTTINLDTDGVKSVDLQDTQTGEKSQLDTDGVFIFVGFNPNNALVPSGTKMNADGYVITDEKCEINIPGIFVIGDLRQKYAKQVVISAADGCTAALAAAHFVETRKASEDECELPAALLEEN